MKKYRSTKIFTTQEMDEKQAKKQGITDEYLCKDGDPDWVRRGYVIHSDGLFVEWVPSSVFNKEYQLIKGTGFGDAVQALKSGKRVQRTGWNGKDMYLFMMHSGIDVDTLPEYERTKAWGAKVDPYVVMRTAQGTYQSGWLASQADIFAEDWKIIE